MFSIVEKSCLWQRPLRSTARVEIIDISMRNVRKIWMHTTIQHRAWTYLHHFPHQVSCTKGQTKVTYVYSIFRGSQILVYISFMKRLTSALLYFAYRWRKCRNFVWKHATVIWALILRQLLLWKHPSGFGFSEQCWIQAEKKMETEISDCKINWI